MSGALAIIVPVLGRPHRVAPLIMSAAAATPTPYRLLFVVNDDDTAELAALEAAGADFLVVPPGERSYAKKINAGFRATTEPLLFSAADDVEFHRGWLQAATAKIDDRIQVVGTNDQCNSRTFNGDHSTHTLFTRAYIDEHGTIDEPGLVLHEGYRHDWVDDEFIATAKYRKVYAHAPDSIVEHLHPNVGKAPTDATYRAGQKWSAQGRTLFRQRSRMFTRPVAIVTACYGGFDDLRPQVSQDVAVEWFCFTDDPDLHVPAPWTKIVAPAEHEHPCLAAKVHKMCPQLEHDDVVWIDANMQITARAFTRLVLAARRSGIATWRHPRRDCIYTEAEASIGAEGQGGKYAGLPIMEQVEHYRTEGHPEHAGLFACGTIAWDRSNPAAVELGAAWLDECVRWTFQDQLSLPVVARRLGIEPGVFRVSQIERSRNGWLENRYLRIHPHKLAVA